MATKKEKEQLLQAEYDGDSHASAALRDIAEEEGNTLPDALKPRRGDWIVIFTGAFFHVGQLLGEDHEFYALAAGSVQIFETGDFAVFFGKGLAKYCETIPTRTNVRKACVTHISEWKFKRAVKQIDGSV